MLAKAPGRRDAVAFQERPGFAQARHTLSEVVDGSAPPIFRCLIVEAQAAGADRGRHEKLPAAHNEIGIEQGEP